MFLSALALAAALQAPPVNGQQVLLQRRPFEVGQRVDQLRAPFPRPPSRTRGELELRRAAGLEEKPVQFKSHRVAGRALPACARPPFEYAAKREEATPRKLSDLPPAHGERAVLRKVDGCPVSTPIIARADAPQP